MSDELIGKKLDDFKVDGVLGKGGMGVVYSATEIGLDRQVAIKVLPDHLAENKDFISRFKREAKAVAKLNHPNVVTIFRVGQAEGYHYIAMEHIQGGDLKDLLTKEGSLSFLKAIEYTRQAASALSAAHTMGILHRDIKPQNIMLDEHDRVKVMDFGIAKLLTPDEDVTSLTMDGALLGTPTHMSKEQCEGLEIDQRADIYALGVVLFQCLTGDVPLKGETPLVVITKILSEEVPDVRTVRKEVPASLAGVLKRATAKNRDDRYATAADFEKDLAKCQKILETGGSEDTFIRHIALNTRNQSKSKLGLLAGLVVACILVALFFLTRKAPEIEPAAVVEAVVVEVAPVEPEVLIKEVVVTEIIREVVTQIVHEVVIQEAPVTVVIPEEPVEVEAVALPGAPERPQGLVASKDRLREVLLRWVAPMDAPAKFQIERALDTKGRFKALDRVLPTDLQYVDRGTEDQPLEDNSTYYYRVISVSPEGVKSLASATLKAQTAPPPSAPSEVTATPSSSRCVTLEWTAPDSEGIETYRIERAQKLDAPAYAVLGETIETSYQDGGTATGDLMDSTAYLYRIRAINRVGSEGTKSEPVKVTTLARPHAVKGLVAEDDEVRCIPIHWEAHENEAVVGYSVYVSDSKDGEFTLLKYVEGAERLSYLHGGRNPGDLGDKQEYFYKVVAQNNIGVVGLDSAVISARTRKVPPRVEAFAGEDDRPREVPLTWERSEDEKVRGYTLWRLDVESKEFQKIATVESRDTVAYVDRGEGSHSKSKIGNLKDGFSYAYQIMAYNTGDAFSEPSEAISVSTKPAPSIPLLLLASSNKVGEITLNWEANPESDIASYEIKSSTHSNQLFRTQGRVKADAEGGLDFTHRSLSNGATQYYRIQALDQEGLTSDWSESIIGSTKPLPRAPRDLVQDYEFGGVTIRWNASSTQDVVGYKIWKKSMFIKWNLTGESDTTSFALMKDVLGKGGVFAISSVGRDGLESARSKSISVKTAEK